jgi:hypothetical protein
MFHPDKVITEINNSCKNYFSESSFRLVQQRGKRYIISGDYLSKAVNNYRNTKEEVKVIKWFADFWLYLDIRFEKAGESIASTFISLSVFQGEDTDEIKNNYSGQIGIILIIMIRILNHIGIFVLLSLQ